MDASPEEQRRTREIVQMFSMKETQDELGGRQVVVVLSDALFPGTSVLHSRARYLLFIPWFFKQASRRTNPPAALETLERSMIKAFRAPSDEVSAEDRLQGLVGRAAGDMVKQLPSTAYWTALSSWDILRSNGTIRDVLKATAGSTMASEADELADRSRALWNSGVGEAPKGFPSETLDGGFRLKPSEASWLRDLWLGIPGDSILAHLARASTPLSGGDSPWTEEICLSAAPEQRHVLDLAHRFSLALEGAQLLYSAVLTDRYIDRGYSALSLDADLPRAALAAWAQEVDEAQHLFNRWDSSELWDFVKERNPRVNIHTTKFFDEWFDLLTSGDVKDLANSSGLREQVSEREVFVKKPAQSRIANPKMLAAWRGSASTKTVFRWGQVRSMVNDLQAGLGIDDAGA